MTGPRQHVHLLVNRAFWTELKTAAAQRGIPMIQLIEIAVRKELDLPSLPDRRDDKKEPKNIPRTRSLAPSKPKIKAGAPAYTRVKEIYNQVVEENVDPLGVGSKGLKRCVALNEKRKRGIRRLMKEVKTLEGVEDFFRKCTERPFNRGENDFGFRADIEYVTREENITKTLEDDGYMAPVVDLRTTYAEKERLARVKEDGRAKVRRHLQTCAKKGVPPKNGLRSFFEEMQLWLKTEDADMLLQSLKNYARDYWKHLKQGAT